MGSLTAPAAEREEALKHAENMGYDCGLNGANTTNCHFSLFGMKELMLAWEKGKRRAALGDANG